MTSVLMMGRTCFSCVTPGGESILPQPSETAAAAGPRRESDWCSGERAGAQQTAQRGSAGERDCPGVSWSFTVKIIGSIYLLFLYLHLHLVIWRHLTFRCYSKYLFGGINAFVFQEHRKVQRSNIEFWEWSWKCVGLVGVLSDTDTVSLIYTH